jgi:1-acyl-sn-glycerol-3-phosphate acyltransferase
MNPFYRTIRTIFRPFLKVFNRMEVIGLEHALTEGPAIVVANHHSYMDAFVLGAAYPVKVRFMVKASQFNKPGTGWFYWGMDAFPVHQGRNDREAMRQASRTLASGGILGMFPAGSRGRQPSTSPWMDGVGMLARRTGAPVVPAALIGTYRALPRGSLLPRPLKVKVVFGEPVRYSGGKGREALGAFVESLRDRVDRMLERGRPCLAGEDGDSAEAMGA